MPLDDPLRWSLVIPVKVLALAKSRLTGLAGPARAELALAMAADTVAAACAAAGSVIVVTDDAQARAELSRLGAVVVPDEPDDGLNAALRFGAAQADERWPGRGRAGLAADLPALGAAELGMALAAAAAAAAAGQAFVADAAGTGTTLYTAAPGVTFWPRFGPASRAAHLSAGAVELRIPGLDGLRRDVDTMDDLRAAAGIGLGPRTAAAAGQLA
jgi:2-phospho-L-lactate/phosphoenolpyruvate guanylyltransferase